MNLRYLRSFVTIADEGTMSKAALRLNIAQPALSRQIRDLETKLGFGLFERLGRRLILSGEGDRLLADCRNILGAVDALAVRAQSLQHSETGLLKVAATPQTIDGVFSTFLRQYSKRFPNVQIQLSEAVGNELFPRLERGELHLGVSFLHGIKPENQDFSRFPLPAIEFLAAGHVSKRLGTSGQIDIGALAPHPLLLMDASFFVRRTFDHFCRLSGLRPTIFMESRAPHALLAFAEAGYGVAVVPSVLPTHRYRLRIARITHRNQPLREPLTVFWNSRRRLPQYAHEFCQLLSAHMSKTFPISRPERTL
jgi:DNA-binding transcriptional LysR family regulator